MDMLLMWSKSPIALIAVVSILIMAAALYAYIPIARRNGWVPTRYKDDPRDKNSKIPVVGGGFVFYVSIMLWSLSISVIYGTTFSMTPLLVGLTMLAACSFADDLLDMRVSTRFIVQVIAILFLIAQFLPIGGLDAPLWLVLPAFMVFALYFINAYNFMDGIDGITSGYSIVVLGSLLWANECQQWFMSGTFIGFALLGALVFGTFNLGKRSTVYCGDVGSISMGYIILSILTYYAIFHNTISILSVVAVYVTDTALTIIRRILLRENIFRPHHRHIYQILTRQRNMPHLLVTIIYCGLQLLITAGYFMISAQYQCIYTITVYILLAICYMLALPLEKKK